MRAGPRAAGRAEWAAAPVPRLVRRWVRFTVVGLLLGLLAVGITVILIAATSGDALTWLLFLTPFALIVAAVAALAGSRALSAAMTAAVSDDAGQLPRVVAIVAGENEPTSERDAAAALRWAELGASRWIGTATAGLLAPIALTASALVAQTTEVTTPPIWVVPLIATVTQLMMFGIYLSQGLKARRYLRQHGGGDQASSRASDGDRDDDLRDDDLRDDELRDDDLRDDDEGSPR